MALCIFEEMFQRARDEEDLRVLELAECGLSFEAIADEVGLPFASVCEIIVALAPERVAH